MVERDRVDISLAELAGLSRPISPHPNLVTASGLEALANAMAEWRAAYNAAQQIEDLANLHLSPR